MRLTVAQALVRFLANQYTERDGVRAAADRRLLRDLRPRQRRRRRPGAARGSTRGDALLPGAQRAGHGARRGGYARHAQPARPTLACTASIGPGATNMVTGAALATINRLPVLLLPGDIFATRAAGTVLQELEDPRSLRRLGQRLLQAGLALLGPHQPARAARSPALLAAMRVLTDPAETGAVTLALPQDVQAEACDWPEELFERRVWHVRRPLPEPDAAGRGRRRCCAARAGPLIVVRRRDDLRRGDRRAARASPRRRASRVAETQAGKGSLPYDHPQRASARSARPARPRPTRWPREADVVLGVGTRWSDFTTASRSALRRPGRALRQPQRRARRRLQAGRAAARGRRPRGLEALRGARRLDGASTRTPSAHARSPPTGTRRSSAPTRSATGRCPRRAR